MENYNQMNESSSIGIQPQEQKRSITSIDCLAFAVRVDTKSGPVVLEAMRRIKTELGVNLTLGAGNISFDLPFRVGHVFQVTLIRALEALHIPELYISIKKHVAATSGTPV